MPNYNPNTIYAIDCVNGMRTYVGDGEIDVIVTSPPYNIGVHYSSYNDTVPRETYLDWMEDVSKECKRVLHDKGSFFLNLGDTSKDPWVAWEVAFRLRRHFVLQNVIHWIKSIAIPKEDAGDYDNIKGDIAVGHFKPVNSDHYLSKCHEYVFHFTKQGDVNLKKLATGVPYQDKSNVGRWKRSFSNGDIRDRGDTWFIPYGTIRSSERERPHPSTFPVKLPRMCIELHGLGSIRVVMDPFMGIGNTALACKALGVPFLGFEIDTSYIEVAQQRLSLMERT